MNAALSFFPHLVLGFTIVDEAAGIHYEISFRIHFDSHNSCLFLYRCNYCLMIIPAPGTNGLQPLEPSTPRTNQPPARGVRLVFLSHRTHFSLLPQPHHQLIVHLRPRTGWLILHIRPEYYIRVCQELFVLQFLLHIHHKLLVRGQMGCREA